MDNKVKLGKYFTLEKELNNVELAKRVITEIDSSYESVESAKQEIDSMDGTVILSL